MSKIRIYELAKELGVDNRVVINKAHELGFPGKSSHSNSLDSDEADKIRRAILRQAVGLPTAAPSQVVTTRVERSGTSNDTVVEKRKGNVVLRRRAAQESPEEPPMADPFAAASTSGSTNSGYEQNGVESRQFDSRGSEARGYETRSGESTRFSQQPQTQELEADEAVEEETRDLEAAMASSSSNLTSSSPMTGSSDIAEKVSGTFPTSDDEEAEEDNSHKEVEALPERMEEPEADEEESLVDAVSLEDSSGSDGTAAEASAALEEEATAAPSVTDELEVQDEIALAEGEEEHLSTDIVEDIVEDEPEAAQMEAPIGEVETAVLEERDEIPTAQREEAGVSIASAAPQQVSTHSPLHRFGVPAERRVIGPRVLGRIELPVKKAPVAKPEQKKAEVPGKKPVSTAPVTAPVAYDEEEEKRKGKGRSKKREISRLDLVDYEGRGGKKGGRPTKHGGPRGHENNGYGAAAQDARGPKASKRVVKLGDVITVGELAKQMSLKVGEVIGKLIGLGVMATINQAIDKDTATLIAEEFGYLIESTSFDEEVFKVDEAQEDPANLLPRPPVVTVMGHVDHGKTSLLDAIREASVAEREHGGITQHIGAYSVSLEDGRHVAFIDTPGHAAFTAMRARGAQVTDIVILVVAADDGVMPQTVEAINHAKAANVPIVVAVNKMDKADANPDRVKQQLLEHGLQPEDWGGDTMYFPVSALKQEGLRELLEGVLLLAEIKELTANPNRKAQGTIIESRQDRGRGTVVTVLVQAGTLRVGDIFVAGATYGRVRSMNDHNGIRVTEAGPSRPVEITGLDGVPQAGDDFFVVDSEANAREVSTNRAEKQAREERALAAGPISLEEFARRANNLAAAELNIILKTDVHGSLEAVKEAIERLSTEKVRVKVLHAAVGGINESDVELAIASKGIVVGFGVRAEPRALSNAENAGVEVRFYRVIYELIDDVRSAMVGLLAPIKEEVPLGRVEVRDTFSVPKIGVVAGCYVVDGIIKRGASVRVVRDSRVVYEGKMSSLRRFKDDVKQVQSGYECGIGIESFNDVKVGDVFEVFEHREIQATL